MADFSYEPDEDFTPFTELMDDTPIPVAGFRMVEYLNEDGDTAYSWAVTGAPGTDNILKMLAVATYQVGAHAMKQYLDALEDDE